MNLISTSTWLARHNQLLAGGTSAHLAMVKGDARLQQGQLLSQLQTGCHKRFRIIALQRVPVQGVVANVDAADVRPALAPWLQACACTHMGEYSPACCCSADRLAAVQSLLACCWQLLAVLQALGWQGSMLRAVGCTCETLLAGTQALCCGGEALPTCQPVQPFTQVLHKPQLSGTLVSKRLIHTINCHSHSHSGASRQAQPYSKACVLN